MKSIILMTALFAVMACVRADEPVDAHVDKVVAEVLANVAKIKAVNTNAVPMAFWDFDGTIIKGDVSEGLVEDGQQKFAGLIEETIKAGYSTVYKGDVGWAQYIKRDYPRMNEIGRWLAWPYNAQIYDGVSADKLDAFCSMKFETVYRKWFFKSSVEMLKQLEAAGVENYIVSASPEIYVRNASTSLGLPRSRFTAIRVEIDGGRMTTKLVYPIPYAEGKVENVRRLVLSRANGIAVAGFGNSYSTDGAFLRYIATQYLPGGAKGYALMINGGEEKSGFEGIFHLVRQNACVR